MERVCVLKSVRIWFKKDFECRYISHLDLNRCMLRALHKSKIPIWHTEGFNPHPFVNECMDVKLEDESFPFEEIISRLNSCLPRGLRVFDVTEPVMKAGKIAFASFTIKISCDGENSRTVCEQLKELLTSESIEVEKKSKKGIKTVDIKQGIKSFEVTEKFDFAELNVVLSAGSSDNVNPNLLISAFENRFLVSCDTDITRNDLYNADMELFR